MATTAKISGAWKYGSPYVKVGGAWKLPDTAWTKVSGTWRQWFLKGGTRDTAFTTNNGTAANSTIYSVAVQSDGKIVIGGAFTTWDGAAVGYIVRLNSDGTRDTAFTTNTGTGANGSTYKVALQSDGKILVVGEFSTWNGTTVNGIVRLNSDGTRDTVFTSNTGTAVTGLTPGFGTGIYAIAIQSDGKIILGGSFTTWNGGSVNLAVRLNTDGTKDTTFSTQAVSGNIYCIGIQSSGKIILGGYFATYNSVAAQGIVRISSTGIKDSTWSGQFNVGNTVYVLDIFVQSDDSVFAAGYVSAYGAGVQNIIKYNSDGTTNSTFSTNVGLAGNNFIYTIAAQPDGKIILGGGLTTWNGATVNYIVRLNSDGTRDTAFTTNTGTTGTNNGPNSITLQSDGKILVGGVFTTWNGATVGRIVRIGGDASA